MLTTEDIQQIEKRGSKLNTIKQQIENFKIGFPFLKIKKAATIGDGIISLSKDDIKKYIEIYNKSITSGLEPLKFTPASGAASRMFKALFNAKKELEGGTNEKVILQKTDIKQFFSQIKNFAFCSEIEKVAGKKIELLSPVEILDYLLTDKGLNYGNLPKGLLLFHAYNNEARTPMEEHMVEGASYSQNKKGIVKMHFTVSPEHQKHFTQLLNQKKNDYEQQNNVRYEISFSRQKPETDTIAVTLENKPFREENGNLLFRPAGHGALLENLNDLDADIIFIKNIDNIVPDRLKQDTIDYKKALAGLLLSLLEKVYFYQEKLNTHHYYGLKSSFLSEASEFLENTLNVHPPQNLYYTAKQELFHYLKTKYNRPIRVCGMVKNEGEPGGGPFLAQNSDQTCSLQIAENSQIDSKNQEQQNIAQSATHFNPVDLICATKNYKGEKFDLIKFRDPTTGFISIKSKNGKDLKAQELPGLWNGAMADWNTIFVEVPISTFNPVKTVNDLLRKEHQSD